MRKDLRHLSLEQPGLSTLCPLLRRGGRWGSLLTFSIRRGDAMVIRDLDSARPKSSRVHFVPTLTAKGGGVLVAPRHDEKTGETTAVYLYHWPSGTALYAPRFSTGGRGVRGTKVPRFPATALQPAVVQVAAPGYATRSYLIVDPVSGGVWCVLDVRPHPTKPRIVETALDLPKTLGSVAGRSHGITAATLYRTDGSSSRALAVDGLTGHVAVLEHDDDPARIRAVPAEPGLGNVLPAGPAPRELTAWPGPTVESVWILDRSTGRLACVTVPRAPNARGIYEVTAAPVAVTVE